MPQNRKQRRAAAAAAAATATDDFDASSIPLSKPPEFSTSSSSSTTTTSADRTRNRQAKTLLEIAAERQEALNAHLGHHHHHASDRHKAGDRNLSFIDLDATETQFLEISSSGRVSTINPNELKTSQQATATAHQKRKPGTEKEEEGKEGEDELPPLIDTLFTSIPLTTVHFTLAFLAAHQYVQEIIWSELVRESLLIAFPVLTFCIHLAHGHIINFSSFRFRPSKNRRQKNTKTTLKSPSTSPAALPTPTPSSILRQALIGDLYAPRTLYFFLPLAILLGALLVQTTNQAGYYAIMRRAPSIGTMWVWCVLEISSPLAALLALVIPLAWGVGVMGYKIY